MSVGHEDWQDYPQWHAAPIEEANDAVLGANATDTYGDFPAISFRSVGIFFNADTAADLQATFQPGTPPLGLVGRTIYRATVEANTDALWVLPAYGDLDSLTVTAPAAGLTYDLSIFGTNQEPYARRLTDDAILFATSGNPIANAATETHELPFYAGRAFLCVDVAAVPFSISIQALDRNAVFLGQPHIDTVAASPQTWEILLPPRWNRLGVTNLSGGASSYTATVIAEPLS